MLNEIFVYKNEWALDGGMIDLIRHDEELFDIAYDSASRVYYFTFYFEDFESCVLLESYIVDSEKPMVSLGRQLHLTRAEVLRNEVDRLENLKLFYQREIVRSEEAVLIGDSDVDVMTAKNAGLDCIGCEWGFRGREELENAGAKYIAEVPQDIVSICHEINRI
jgi:hypothetical protein